MKTTIFVVALFGLCIIPCACQRRVKVPNVTDHLQLGETYFEAGDYLKAIQAYESYLGHDLSETGHDRVLFHLALAYAFSSSASHNQEKAISLFERLLIDFPESPYKSQVEFILGLQAQVGRLRLERDRLNSEMDDLRSTVHAREQQVKELEVALEQLKSNALQKEEQIRNLKLQLLQLKNELLQREEHLKNLKIELEELKRIDLERRSPQPTK